MHLRYTDIVILCVRKVFLIDKGLSEVDDLFTIFFCLSFALVSVISQQYFILLQRIVNLWHLRRKYVETNPSDDRHCQINRRNNLSIVVDIVRLHECPDTSHNSQRILNLLHKLTITLDWTFY